MKSVNFTVMQLKESWLMFYNLYSCFDIFLTILLLLTINIFCISVYVDMCSPINVVPIFTFKMRRKDLSPPPVYLFYSHYYCTHTSGTRCVETFPHQANSLCHQLAVLRFNSILIGSIWRYIRFHRWAQSHKTAPCHIHTHTRVRAHTHTSDASHKPWPTGYRSEIPRTLSSGLINLLGWLAELKTFTYIYQFIKGYDKRYRWTTRWKMHRGRSERVLRTGASVPMRLVYVTLWLTINSNTSPSPFSKERGKGWKLQATNHGLVFLVTSLHPGDSQEPFSP